MAPQSTKPLSTWGGGFIHMVCVEDHFYNFFAVRFKKKKLCITLVEKINKILILELLRFAQDWEADQASASPEIKDLTVYGEEWSSQLANLVPPIPPAASCLTVGLHFFLTLSLLGKFRQIIQVHMANRKSSFFSTDFSPPGQTGLKVQKPLASSFPYCSSHLTLAQIWLIKYSFN